MYLYWLYKDNKAPLSDEKNEVEINQEVEIVKFICNIIKL